MAPNPSRVFHGPLEGGLARLLMPPGTTADDFLAPPGEAALLPPDAVSWQVFSNPISLFVGGVAAVVLELAEPGVRTGVWTHSTFRERPLERLQRTGYAAMMTVYGPRRRTEAMIAGVTRRHARVQGDLPGGGTYSAADPVLLDWVHATAAFGFLEAYHAHVAPVSTAGRDRYYAEGETAARLYGATAAPDSESALDALFERMGDRLEPSPVILEFLAIVRRMPALPWVLRPLQGWLVDAAVAVLPGWIRARLGLSGLRPLAGWQRAAIDAAAAALARTVLVTHPAVLACRRLGLPDDYLFGGDATRRA